MTRLKALTGFILVLAVACGLKPSAAPLPTAADTLNIAAMLSCPSELCRPPNLDSASRMGCRLTTSRDLNDYKKLDQALSFTDVCARVGVPDWETGSGLMIYVYDLPDSSRIFIGFAGPNQLMYVNHLLANGGMQILVRH